MDKVIEYMVKRKIESISVSDNLCAYRELRYIGDNLQSHKEGLTEKSLLDEIINETGIKNSKFSLCKLEILETLRNSLLFQDYRKIEDFVIRNPYTYISEHGLKDVSALNISTCDHNIYSLEGNKYPKAIFFDYISANMNNAMYNLEIGFDILRKRQDISFCKDEIQQIPYYNSDKNRNNFLEFIWKPSDKDFSRISNINDSYTMYSYIITEIFGIPRLKEL